MEKLLLSPLLSSNVIPGAFINSARDVGEERFGESYQFVHSLITQSIVAVAPFLVGYNQAAVPQAPQVIGDVWLKKTRCLHNLTNCQWALAQCIQNAQARGIAEAPKKFSFEFETSFFFC
jgi:hypothetical protein